MGKYTALIEKAKDTYLPNTPECYLINDLIDALEEAEEKIEKLTKRILRCEELLK